MALAVTEQELVQIIEESDFIKIYGFALHSFAEGECTIYYKFRRQLERPGGVVSGPVFMAAADMAVWFAIITLIGTPEGLFTVTADLQTSFMSVAKGEDFLCKARVLKIGKRLAYAVAECVTPSGKLLTHHTATYIRPDSKSQQA